MKIISNKGLLGIYDESDNFVISIPTSKYTLSNNIDTISLEYNDCKVHYKFNLDDNTYIDGEQVQSLNDLVEKLSAFSSGGGDGDGVTWDQVTDKPLYTLGTPLQDAEGLLPVYTQNGQLPVGMPEFPENAVPLILLDERVPVLEQGNFLVGGENENQERGIQGDDIGLSGSGTWSLAAWHKTNKMWLQGGYTCTAVPTNGAITLRTNTGQGRFAPASNPDEAVVLSQLDSSLENKVDKETGKGLSEENFTTDEKLKLSGLESPKFKGQFLSLAELTSADVGEVGGYAYVDGGVGGTVDLYIWDAVNSLWEIVAGESTAETPASIKSKYESNPDTNAFTDDLKNKLEAFTANFTSALKTAYDNAVSWISTNGANILNHLSNKSNPHEVTANQIGLGNVNNTSDANKPVSIATQTALDNKVNFPATNGHIPVRTSTGLQGSQPFTSATTGNTIMFRDSNGRSHVAAPTENTHIANKAYADRVWMPDYSNMETTNMITTHGGTWTVPSGRRGWVKLYTRTYTGGVLDAEVFLINGKVMENIWHEATSGTGTARSGSRSGLFQVKGGDTVQVHGNLERSCYFIPGIWV